MDADLDTLVIALYVKTDELLQRAPQLAPWRPAVGIAPKLTDAELVTLAVLQALLATRAGQTLITDKNYYGVRFEAELAAQGVRLLRPARKGEHERAGAHLFKPLRQDRRHAST